MFNININLFIASFDLVNNYRCVVSKSQDSYSPLVLALSSKHHSIETAIQELFEMHVEMGFGWTKCLTVDIIKQDDEIDIYYACSIPPDTPLKNSYYINANIASINSIARKSLLYV